MVAPGLVGHSIGSDEYLTHEQCRNKPTIEPGQIWVVECEAASLSTFHAELLTRANVVLYERVLLAAVAEALPMGVYAEALPATAAAVSPPKALLSATAASACRNRAGVTAPLIRSP